MNINPTNNAAADSALTKVLPLFTAVDVPIWGPSEEEIDPPIWEVSEKETDLSMPGGGLSRFPMLYIGEGCNKMFLINEGKVAWTFSSGTGWEYDDIWLMTNGNIVFSRQTWAGEVTPGKELVWRLDCVGDDEIHAIQPIGLDKVLIIVNSFPPILKIINKGTGEIEVQKELPYDPEAGIHAQFRRGRMTAQGTFLIPFLTLGKVVEYDRNWNEIWSYQIKSPWAAVRLHNGNTLITGEHDQVTREVNSNGETIWEIYLSDLPEKYRLHDSQSCVRLANGNTILCSRGNGGKSPQLVEVTPSKEVVWVINDWKNLGPATAVQILSEAGIPEVPGECQR
jgi:hypothetical protein